jgi:hypothetical protein
MEQQDEKVRQSVEIAGIRWKRDELVRFLKERGSKYLHT